MIDLLNHLEEEIRRCNLGRMVSCLYRLYRRRKLTNIVFHDILIYTLIYMF